jgi:Cdc6-like AAA superfamily ATPase
MKTSFICIIRGRPGAGKTTLSHELSKKLNAVILRKDDIYDAFPPSVAEHQSKNKVCYDSLFKILESNRETNASFIIDYPFQKNEDLLSFKKWLSKKGFNSKFLFINSLNEKKSDQSLADFDQLKSHYDDLKIEPIEGELLLDSANRIESLIEEAVKQIQS